MSIEPFEDLINELAEEFFGLDESDAINVVRHCLGDNKDVWHQMSNNPPPESGRYILYLCDEQDVSFTWVGKYNSVSETWEVRLPFLVRVDMWRYFPKQPNGHKHEPFILDDITGTIGGSPEVVRE